MKKLRLVLIAIALVNFCADVSAQSKSDSLLFADRIWSLKKKALVLQYLQLTEAEKASFWPVYEGYHTAIRQLEMEYIYLMSSYIKEQGHQVYGGSRIFYCLRNSGEHCIAIHQVFYFITLEQEYRVTIFRVEG